MALPTFARATVIRIRATTKLDHGSEIRDWANPDRQVFRRCLVQPAGSSEDIVHRETLRGTYDVLLPTTDENYQPADVLNTDRLILPNGRTYTITGEPADETGPTGLLEYVQILAQRIS